MKEEIIQKSAMIKDALGLGEGVVINDVIIKTELIIIAALTFVFLLAILLVLGWIENKAKKRKLKEEPVKLEEQRKQVKEEPSVTAVEVDRKIAVEAQKREVAKIETKQVVEQIHQKLPQDSLLRRHYLTHLKMMITSIYTPEPTDSALKRHYESMISGKIADCLDDDAKMARLVADYEEIKKASTQQFVAVKAPDQRQAAKAVQSKMNVPEDSMLRRHYLTHVRSMLEAIHAPRPTDSALKRHHDTMIAYKLEECLCCHNTMAKLEAFYQQVKRQVVQTLSVQSEAIIKVAKSSATQAGAKVSKIPEDSMLRRHYLTHLRSLIEVDKGARPTDSMLKRHYDTMINSELEQYLKRANA